jgi:predicted ester cyclase
MLVSESRADRARRERGAATMADNTGVVRRIFDEVINKGDLDVVDELFDAEFETQTPQGRLDREGFKGYVQAWRAGFPDVRCEVGDLVSEGDRVAWSIRATGTHTGDFMGIPPTGNSVDFDSLNIAELRGGRLYRHQVMMDLTKMTAQLGVG